MESQKLDAELSLALDTPVEERVQSGDLNVGYDMQTRRWELIIRYIGDIDYLSEKYDITVTKLLGGYAVINVLEEMIGELIKLPEIIYIEKPNNMYVVEQMPAASPLESQALEKEVSCITQFSEAVQLRGQGVIVAIIDSGIDYTHPDFCKLDGTTRILALWDQSANAQQGQSPQGYNRGVEYSREQLDQALAAGSKKAQLAIVPQVDTSGHGTFVAGVAAGNGRASGTRLVRGSDGVERTVYGSNTGVAPESELLVVKLGNPQQGGLPRTTELMLAVDYVVRCAGHLARPVAINLSFGNNYGSHDGQTLLETYIDQAVSSAIGNICIGTGNEGDTGKHTKALVRAGVQVQIPMAVAAGQQGFSVQVWKNYVDRIQIAVQTPDGRVIGPFDARLGARRYELNQVLLDVYYDFPKPYQKAQIIYIDIVPINQSVPSGEWRIYLTGETVVDGRVDLWLPVSGATNADTRFLLPDVDTSLTIPSTSSMAVSVGAYNSQNDSYAAFSGRGYTRTDAVKPDLVAPGVDVTSCAPGGGYTVKSGTSIATPFVTGAVALMMEWGVVRGFDAYLYGEKVKAFLQRGARALPGYQNFPNPQVGYGALCLRDSIPF